MRGKEEAANYRSVWKGATICIHLLPFYCRPEHNLRDADSRHRFVPHFLAVSELVVSHTLSDGLHTNDSRNIKGKSEKNNPGVIREDARCGEDECIGALISTRCKDCCEERDEQFLRPRVKLQEFARQLMNFRTDLHQRQDIAMKACRAQHRRVVP